MVRVDNPPSEQSIQIDDDATIYAKIEGQDDGKPIVLVHGFALNHTMWKYQVPYLKKKGYRVVAIDLRGFGDSWNPNQPQKAEEYTYETWANDLGTVLEKLDLHDVTLAGYSMGGAVAMQYMSGPHPRVEKLVLVSATGPNMQEDLPPPDDSRLKATCWGFEAFTVLIRDFESVGSDKAFEKFTLLTFPTIQGVDLIGGTNDVQWIRDMFESASHQALVGGLTEMRNRDLTQGVSTISTPTIICHGLFDPFVPFALGKHLESLIEDATFTTLMGGHGVFFEQAEELNRALAGERIPDCPWSWCPVRKVIGKMSDG